MVVFRVPESTATKIILRPKGFRFVTGVATHYENQYPEQIKPFVEFDDYQNVITDINDIITSFWPCVWAILFGYIFCPITLGLSLLVPNICVRDVELEIRRIISSANKNLFGPKGINMELHKGCFVSWIEINLPEHSQPTQKNLISNETDEIDRV